MNNDERGFTLNDDGFRRLFVLPRPFPPTPEPPPCFIYAHDRGTCINPATCVPEFGGPPRDFSIIRVIPSPLCTPDARREGTGKGAQRRCGVANGVPRRPVALALSSTDERRCGEKRRDERRGMERKEGWTRRRTGSGGVPR